MQRNHHYTVVASFILSILLMVLPLPSDWRWMRPEWVMLVLIYWVFTIPHAIGVFTGFCLGFSLDVLRGGILGQSALVMTLVAFLAHGLRNRFRLFPAWQQIFCVLLLVTIGQLISAMVQWLIGHPPEKLYWLSTLTSIFCWPWIVRLLHVSERKA